MNHPLLMSFPLGRETMRLRFCEMLKSVLHVKEARLRLTVERAISKPRFDVLPMFW